MSKNKSNNRQKERRKRKREERLEKIKMDKLYNQSMLDPETVEGQMYIDPDLLIDNSKQTKQTENKIGWKEYFKSFFNF